jgi:serine protein kinase
LLAGSALAGLPITPFALELLGRVVIASRLRTTNKCKPAEKVLIYDGRDLRDDMPQAPTLYDLTEEAGLEEGMTGISTRTAFKIIARAANMGDEIGLDPIELFQIIRQDLKALGSQEVSIAFADEQSKSWLKKQLGDMIREALLEDYDEFAQVRFQRYVEQCEAWLNPDVGAIMDPDTGQMLDKSALEKKLKEIEDPAKIISTKDFRNDVVSWVLRYKLAHDGSNPQWDEYRPMKNVIKHLVEKQTQDLLPLIQFGPKRDSELDEKHKLFLGRMEKRGFTSRQTRRVVAWYLQVTTTS